MSMKNFEPRPYQQQLLNYAIDNNCIIYLPTGSGKTYIAVMIIKHFSNQPIIKLSAGGTRCILMCNTVELARQNAQAILRATNLSVDILVGDLNFRKWPAKKWEEVLNSSQVLVGTTQVFVNLLSHRYLNPENISCVVMDECHYARKAHAMHRFLSLLNYRVTNVSRVVGLTGVLLKSVEKNDVVQSLEALESVFRGRIVTVSSFDEYQNVLMYSSAPNERLTIYHDDSNKSPLEHHIRDIVSDCLAELANVNMLEKKALSKNLQIKRDEPTKENIKIMLSDFIYQLADLGFYAAKFAIKGIIIRLNTIKRNYHSMYLKLGCRHLITQCERIQRIIINEVDLCKNELDHENLSEVIYQLSTAKLKILLSLIECEFSGADPDDFSCLTFVNRRNTAKWVYNVIRDYTLNCENLHHIKPDFMVGKDGGSLNALTQTKNNKEIVEKFRKKKCNLLVSSRVLEEGIDVPSCNYVICFDEITCFSSYIQMRGRARSRNSIYALVTNSKDTEKVINQITYYQNLDKTLKDYLWVRAIDSNALNEKLPNAQLPHLIPPLKTAIGAILEPEGALELLCQYCQSLLQGSTLTWSLSNCVEGKVQVTLQLPIQSPIKDTIYSDYMGNGRYAKMSAAMKTCVQLYEMGELTEYLIPNSPRDVIENVTELYFAKWQQERGDHSEIAGTRKHIRKYAKLYPMELCAAWPKIGKPYYVHCIKFIPKFPESDLNDERVRIISNLLISEVTYAFVSCHKLPAIAPMPLFLNQGVLHVAISKEPITCVITTQDQLDKLKIFTKTIISDILISCWQRFLAIDHQNEMNSLLIAPIKSDYCIDWKIVYQLDKIKPTKSLNVNDLLGKIVSSSYRPETRYVVTKIRRDLNPLSVFPSKIYNNFFSYYKAKYGIHIQDTKQALIEVQEFSSRRNFFINAAGKSAPRKRPQNEQIMLIPELCDSFNYSGTLWLKTLLLPSIIHRLHYLLHAERLRNEINNYLGIKVSKQYQPKTIQIDRSLRRVFPTVDYENARSTIACDTIRNANTCSSTAEIPGWSERKIDILCKTKSSITSAEQYEFLAAITTASSSDVYDMERFEILGDSFLKFSVSLLLMHQHPKWNEGKLTIVKSQMVSNRNLLYCMRAKFSGSFICSSRFDPTVEWLPPNTSVPLNILKSGLSDEQLKRCLLEIRLSESEVLSGVCHQDTLDKALQRANTPGSTADALNEFLCVQLIADKTVADCLEALLGVCVKNYGIRKSFEMLDYFGIFYDTEKKILPNLLDLNLGSPLLRSTVEQFEIDQYLTNHSSLEATLGYKFTDRAYLLQALTHPSYPTNRITGCYQELEFIGDAILDFLISCYIYEGCGHMNPGEITDLRSALVNNATLACVTVRSQLHRFMLHDDPSLMVAIRSFVSYQNTQNHIVGDQVKVLLEENDSPESFNLVQNIDVPKALGDVFEAVIGAIFLDSGNDLLATWNVVSHLMDIELNRFAMKIPINPVRELFEHRGANPIFQTTSESEVCEVSCTFKCGNLIKTVYGTGKNKSLAKRAAAKMAIQILRKH